MKHESESFKILVTTIINNYISTVLLPAKIKGRFWLSSRLGDRLLSIEGINNCWIIKSNKKVKLLDTEGNILKNIEMEPSSVYTAINEKSESVFIFTEQATDDRQIFSKYIFKNDVDVTIGRNANNDISYNSIVVSGRHAILSLKNGQWHLKDEKSANGTFVNEKRAVDTDLKFGDRLFIMGLKIVVGKRFLAVNNPDGAVSFSSKLTPFVKQTVSQSDEEDEYEPVEEKYFYRSPRFKRDVSEAKFKIDPPPSNQIGEQLPWPLVIGSSIAMGLMSVVTLITALSADPPNISSAVMGGSMLFGTLILPLITKLYENSRKKKKEALRQEKYTQYLESFSEKISAECSKQEQILRENSPQMSEYEDRIINKKRTLWERTVGQTDFLTVRLGHGSGPLKAEFSYQERKFTIEDDNLQENMLSLCEAKRTLNNIPILLSLAQNYVSGIIGPHDRLIEVAKGFVIQMASLYSYDEVKFIFLYDESDESAFEFVKWLPHVWNDDNRFRFIATNVSEAKEVSAFLEDVVNERGSINDSEIPDLVPYYVCISLSKTLSARADVLKQFYSLKKDIHFCSVSFFDALNDLPKECSMVAELKEDGTGVLFDKNDISGETIAFIPDIYLKNDPLDLSIKLANIKLDIANNSFKLPKTLSFLEMFKVGKVEHLNSLTRWKENDPTKSLGAPVGVDTLGDDFRIDLHEKFHGPHGLIAGMTGSGKSEFIITYILSMAVNYHPNEVAFVLIDYKGGGMAKAFENLPHTAGIITNLDGGAIKRSLVSIESELKRRQLIFSQASKKVAVSNIDIYKYQKLFREGSVSEPLPHLFIISDEFAELKVQQPEFMTQLVSTARIGRSLGVHLILATQKPSGVVDDQIWSNSKFRVCLKVQDRPDSMDMLKRPEAAEITDVGRFYLQVGYNELFELGQSAYAGAPYYPSDRVIKAKDDSVVFIDRNGRHVREVRMDKRRAKFGKTQKQLDAINEYLQKIADEEGIKTRPLWLPPLEPVIMLDKLFESYNYVPVPYELNPVIGEFDDPARQRRGLLTLPLSKEGNTIVYGSAGSGKTSFVNAMLVSLIKNHTPDEVNLYLLDFASETLRAFASAPHVGGVILAGEGEKVNNLFRMLMREVGARKKLFADYGGDFNTYLSLSGKKMPSIVVVIHNYSAFDELYEEKEESVAFLTREGSKYGIYFVLTSLSANGVRFKLLQNFRQLFVLQMNDESDYASVLGKTDGLTPAKYKGRGLVRTDDLYEFQVASFVDSSSPFNYIYNLSAELEKDWAGEKAKKINILPAVVTPEFVEDKAVKGSMIVPVGVAKGSLEVQMYSFERQYVNVIASYGDDYKPFLGALCGLIGQYSQVSGVVFDVPGSFDGSFGTLTTVRSAEECENQAAKLYDLLLYRNNTYKTAKAKGESCELFERVVIIINSFSALKGVLSETCLRKMQLVLEKGEPEYNVSVILGDQLKGITASSFEAWYKLKLTSQDGIWVGSGVTDQYLIKASKNTPEMREDISNDFGFAFVKGKATMIKLLSAGEEAEAEDE